MATATLPPPSTGPNRAASVGVVLTDVSWSDYLAQLRIVGENRVRVTYDQGIMEVMMPSLGHDEDIHLLGRIVDTITEELDIEVKGGLTTTHKRSDLKKGAEPDQCYWLGAGAQAMRGKRELDLATDPPPDLIIEVDVTSSALPRLPIFAAMGVPEVWHVTKSGLRFLHLQLDSSYAARPESRAFPILAATDVASILAQARPGGPATWLRALRDLIRQRRGAVGP